MAFPNVSYNVSLYVNNPLLEPLALIGKIGNGQPVPFTNESPVSLRVNQW